MCYVTPSHQFPTGVTMPAGRRAELLHWAARRPGQTPEQPGRETEDCSGLAAHVHCDTRRSHRDQAQLHTEQAHPPERHRLKYRHEQKQHPI